MIDKELLHPHAKNDPFDKVRDMIETEALPISAGDDVGATFAYSFEDIQKQAGISKLYFSDVGAAHPIMQLASAASNIGGYGESRAAILQGIRSVEAAGIKTIGVFDQLVGVSASVQDRIQQLTSGAVTSIFPKFADIGVVGIPDPRILTNEILQFDNDLEFLERQGFDFLNLWLEYPEIIGISTKPERQRSALLTRALLNVTTRGSFLEELSLLISSHIMLKKRRKIVLQAYHAHTQKMYHLSVMAFMSQIDGMWTDALVKYKILKRVRSERGVHYIDMRSLNRSKKERKVTFTERVSIEPFTSPNHEDGLQPLQGRLQKHIDDRNAMMHGDSVRFGTAKMSTLSLLMLLILASEIDVYDREVTRKMAKNQKNKPQQ